MGREICPEMEFKSLSLVHSTLLKYSFRENSVCILLSSEWLGIILLNFEVLIDVSTETFRNSCTRNLEYLRLRKLQLIITDTIYTFSVMI